MVGAHITLVFGLDGRVDAYNDTQKFLGSSSFALDGTFSFSVVAGRTYFVLATASFGSTGAYLVSLTPAPDDFGDDFDQAAPLVLSADGSGSQAGSIEMPGDVDIFQFVAPITGRFTATPNAAEGSALSPSLTVFDGNRNPLAVNDAGGLNGPSNKTTFAVISSQTYYLQAIASPKAANGQVVGIYTLGLNLRFTELAGRELEPNDTRGTVAVIGVGSTTVGTIGPNDIDLFAFIPLRGGRFTAQLHAEGVSTRLSLLDEQGQLLVQSEGISPSNRENQIDQHITSGTYYLRVESHGGVGVYSLTTELTAGSAPFQGIAVADTPRAFAFGDFNGNGIIDLASANASGDVSVVLGRGDGTFQDQRRFDVGPYPVSLVMADLNADGRLDLATANASGDVSVLLGRGDGTFQDQHRFGVGDDPFSVVPKSVRGPSTPQVHIVRLFRCR
jgi:hypothetical protein